MDIKRLLLALGLSFVFIVVWQTYFGPDPKLSDNEQPITSDENKPSLIDPLNPSSDIVDAHDESKQQAPVVSNKLPNLDSEAETWPNSANSNAASFITMEIGHGSSIQELKIVNQNRGGWNKDGSAYNDQKGDVLLINDAQCNPCLFVAGAVISFKNTGDYTGELVAKSESGVITKHTRIDADNPYLIIHEFTGLPSTAKVALLWDGGLLPSEKKIEGDDLYNLSLFFKEKNSYNTKSLSGYDGGPITKSNINWGGVRAKYFMKAITSHDIEPDNIKFDKLSATSAFSGIKDQYAYPNITLNYDSIPNGTLAVESYIGPIDPVILQHKNTEHLVPLFGWGWWIIGYLSKLIHWLLTSLHKFGLNYGVICILFAFIIRLITGPLTKKSFLSNQKMQAVQPKIKKIQEKYKDDQARLSQETMKMYKNEGVNPLGGCLPILIQMPLLIAVFTVFRYTIEFRGAAFLPVWITDLSQPDVMIPVPAFLSSVPFIGHGIALLPIIMGVVMFLNMQMTSVTAQGSQKIMMYFMNAFFILLFNSFPSGLNLYYTMYNILNFIQQKQLKQLPQA